MYHQPVLIGAASVVGTTSTWNVSSSGETAGDEEEGDEEEERGRRYKFSGSGPVSSLGFLKIEINALLCPLLGQTTL